MADEQQDQLAEILNAGSETPFDISKLLNVGSFIKNLDIVSILKKLAEKLPDDPDNDTATKIKEALDKFDTMSAEEKTEFQEKIKEQVAQKIKLKFDNPEAFKGIEDALNSAIMYKVWLVTAGVVLLVFLTVFFGYKLYKSIKDKEVKREEKKKLKQMKKKK